MELLESGIKSLIVGELLNYRTVELWVQKFNSWRTLELLNSEFESLDTLTTGVGPVGCWAFSCKHNPRGPMVLVTGTQSFIHPLLSMFVCLHYIYLTVFHFTKIIRCETEGSTRKPST